MKRHFLLIYVFSLFFISLHASDTLSTKRPQFVSLTCAGGAILSNNHIFKGDAYKSPLASSISLKYGWSKKNTDDYNHFYGNPYRGVGVFMPHFEHHRYMGTPFSIYMFQGARLKQVNPMLSLHYEINLGLSFNWNHYDRVSKPDYISIGSKVNAHLAGNIYLKWRLSTALDLNTGVTLTHFSNGAQRVPNYGINMLSAYVEVVYHLQRKQEVVPTAIYSVLPKQRKKMAHDVTVFTTQRAIKIESEGTSMLTKYPRKRFFVAGLSYATLFDASRRIKLGPSIEATYDESANALFIGHTNLETGEYTETVELGKSADRYSIGISLKGEFAMPGYAIVANVGHDLYHKDKRDMKLYFIYGMKLYLTKQLYGTLSVRTTNLTRSRYLYVGVGMKI